MRLCIDPGLRWCGACVGDGGGILEIGLVVNPCDQRDRGPAAWQKMAHAVYIWAVKHVPTELYIEIPRIYPRADQRKGDLNDLIELAGVAGAISSLYGHVQIRHYYPAEWKGQVPKKIMTERIRKKLSPAELDNFHSVGAKDHNSIDAAGIFLHSVGRL